LLTVAPARRRRRRLRTAVAAVLSIAVALALGGTAHADPSTADIEKQIDALWNEAEPLIEAYNLKHDEYLQNKAKQEELTKEIAPLQAQVDLVEAKVGAMAAAAYKGGSVDALTTMLTATSPDNFVDQLGYLEQLAHGQDSLIAEVRDTKAAYEKEKQPLDALVAELTQQDAELAAQKDDIDKRVNALQTLRQQVGQANTGKFRPWTCPTQYLQTKGYTAAAWACSQAGKPYVWAAAGPNSYDCSGLVMRAWERVGVYLPHQSAAMRRSVRYITRAELQIGDLVFYFNPIHHVAIYVGDGKIMQAPRAGDYVRMTDMDNGHINSYGRPG
jgi:cell wall-associated NlpC family hydrolase